MSEKVCKIAEVQLSYKSKIKSSDRPKITNSDDAFKIFLDGWDKDSLEDVEEFKLHLQIFQSIAFLNIAKSFFNADFKERV